MVEKLLQRHQSKFDFYTASQQLGILLSIIKAMLVQSNQSLKTKATTTAVMAFQEILHFKLGNKNNYFDGSFFIFKDKLEWVFVEINWIKNWTFSTLHFKYGAWRRLVF